MTPPRERPSANMGRVEDVITVWQQELKGECARRLGVLPPFISTNLNTLKGRLAKATQETYVLRSEGIVDGENFQSLHSSSGRLQSTLGSFQSSILSFDPLLASLMDIKSSLVSFSSKSSVGAVRPLLANADREQFQRADFPSNPVNAGAGDGVHLLNSLNADANNSTSTQSSKLVDDGTDITHILLALNAANAKVERKHQEFADLARLIKTLVKSVEDDAVEECSRLTTTLESLRISSEKEPRRAKSTNQQRQRQAAAKAELLTSRLRIQRRMHMSTSRQLKRQMDHMTQASKRNTISYVQDKLDLTEQLGQKDAEVNESKTSLQELRNSFDEQKEALVKEKARAKRLDEDLTSKSTAATNAKDEVRRIQGLLDGANSETSRVQELLNGQTAETSRIQVQLDGANSENDRLQALGDKSTAENDRLQELIKGANSETSRVQELLNGQTAETGRIQALLDSSTADRPRPRSARRRDSPSSRS
ncbi:uncharacterized protein BDZ99DRAFT_478095 [Mytilinidion resinicola]|uniref:Uncharacterized protein n=1 Tax=Mytilinidion resinicola TaxID=574789 RepID=A0A6A6YIK9_9PEZI|nr:uncharacterized protein BDZ99DRAFT_478095 [Mytilinidion resinicola]KAF2808630.1 hypothetical protein BDZ99DRAFT_478095 [Mytilinidion resinicola]